ncbi:MAG: dimethylargininase [Mycobacteriales bacterium]
MIRLMRSYLMCPPTYFNVQLATNDWMDTTASVDLELANKQWAQLKETYEQLGHSVELLDPVPNLPDMVFSANAAFSVDGAVLGARFRFPHRAAEAVVQQRWYATHGWTRFTVPTHINEGEGDLVYLPASGLILAGYGFRTDPAAHPEVSETLSRPVVSLRLVDKRFYHLDLALFALNDAVPAYYPDAFSSSSQRILAQLFPDALLATELDALAFGLNAVSDGHHVVMPPGATQLQDALVRRGYEPICIDLSELVKGGGSIKCCTAELRPGTAR